MGKILIVLSNKTEFEDSQKNFGFWFSEFVHFYTIVKLQGYEVEIVSPLGGEVFIDKLSTKLIFIDREAQAYYNSEEFMKNLNQTKSLDEIKTRYYKAVYIVGGLGAFTYFADNMRLKEVILKIFANGGIVAAIGFGVIALLNLEVSDNVFLIDRKQITGISLLEETLLGVRKFIPVHLQLEIQKRKAFYSKAFFPLTSYTIKDGRIITGENSQSARAVAWQLILSLKE